MKQIIEDLFKLDRYLLGDGYDKALDYIDNIIPLDVIHIPSGTKLETWEVPQEWIIRDGWIKFNGEKIVDFQKDRLAVSIGSIPVHKTVNLEELKKHLDINTYLDTSTPYTMRFYQNDWGFNMPAKQYRRINVETKETEVALQEGDYEVFIDSEYKPGTMKIGVHTVLGKTDREILLFAHLDHPWQANDNLSGVACLIDLSKQLFGKFNHTIKIIFCPETIGSIAYALTQDLSKVDFVIALDCIGNDHDILWQKTFDLENKLNRVMHLAVTNLGQSHRKGNFRKLIGSDEYVFNDLLINIPAIMLSRWDEPEKSFREYHTSYDVPAIVREDKIKEVQEIILKAIDIWEKDYVPIRNFKAPLFRQKYGIQTPYKDLNLSHDYLIYSLDGKKSLAELCCEYALNFDFTYEWFNKMLEDKIITKKSNKKRGRPKKINEENSGIDTGKGGEQTPPAQEQTQV